jgi:repressor LexA
MSTDTPALTARQRDILLFIEQTVQRNGAPPTRAEISEFFGFKSPNAAEEHLRALAKKGVIEVVGGTSRGIRLRRAAPAQQLGLPGLQQLVLPLIGRVAAGSPILAQEHTEDHYPVDGRLFSQRPDYLLRVRGLSMRDAGILDGDLVAVRSTTDVRDGQTVVARLGDDVTVKRLAWPGGRSGGRPCVLQAANPDFKDIVLEPGQPLHVEGLVVGLIRTHA